MKGDQKTCGDLYAEGVAEFGNTPEKYWAFAAGFASGQAEKVYNGVCVAAMFRPSSEHLPMLSEILASICPRYNLFLVTCLTRGKHEVWIYRADREDTFGTLFQQMRNLDDGMVTWNILRAMLCGIPLDEIDTLYHTRENFNKKCD